jgi:hypothetical protein
MGRYINNRGWKPTERRTPDFFEPRKGRSIWMFSLPLPLALKPWPKGQNQIPSSNPDLKAGAIDNPDISRIFFYPIAAFMSRPNSFHAFLYPNSFFLFFLFPDQKETKNQEQLKSQLTGGRRPAKCSGQRTGHCLSSAAYHKQPGA